MVYSRFAGLAASFFLHLVKVVGLHLSPESQVRTMPTWYIFTWHQKCQGWIIGWKSKHPTYKMGPETTIGGLIPSHTHLQPWLNRVCWGYNYLITRGALLVAPFTKNHWPSISIQRSHLLLTYTGNNQFHLPFYPAYPSLRAYPTTHKKYRYGSIGKTPIFRSSYLEASWWFEPIWKILVKLDHLPKYRDEQQIFETNHLGSKGRKTRELFVVAISRPALPWTSLNIPRDPWC